MNNETVKFTKFKREFKSNQIKIPVTQMLYVYFIVYFKTFTNICWPKQQFDCSLCYLFPGQ